MEYELIDVDETSILIIAGKEPIFLNETGSIITRKYLNGCTEQEILDEISKVYYTTNSSSEQINEDIRIFLAELIEKIN